MAADPAIGTGFGADSLVLALWGLPFPAFSDNATQLGIWHVSY